MLFLPSFWSSDVLTGNQTDAYLRDRIVAELDTRDRTWLQTGEAPEVTWGKAKEMFQSTKEGKRDLFAIQSLAGHGFKVSTRAETAPEGRSNIDLAIADGVLWEIKSPDGGNVRAIESNMRKAKKQFAKAYAEEGERISGVNVVLNGRYLEGMSDEAAMARARTEADRHGIDGLLYVTKDGSVRRIT